MKKILVIEDEADYSSLLTRELTAEGFDVVVAENGEKGLEVAKGEMPDLILLDIRLPKMSGMQMLENLRKEKAGKSVKVILLTNLEPDEELIDETVKNAPMCYFVKSDIKLADLKVKIKEVISE